MHYQVTSSYTTQNISIDCKHFDVLKRDDTMFSIGAEKIPLLHGAI